MLEISQKVALKTLYLGLNGIQYQGSCVQLVLNGQGLEPLIAATIVNPNTKIVNINQLDRLRQSTCSAPSGGLHLVC